MKNENTRIIVIALSLFLIDAFVLNQGSIAVITIIVIAFWWLPRVGLKLYRKQPIKKELKKIFVYGCMAIAVLSANYINNQVAANRARVVISAVETYHVRNGVYPTSLNDLVPSYLTNVPKAKYTLSGFNDFRYRNIDGFTSIQYTSVPPFGRPTYVFNQRKWIYID